MDKIKELVEIQEKIEVDQYEAREYFNKSIPYLILSVIFSSATYFLHREIFVLRGIGIDYYKDIIPFVFMIILSHIFVYCFLVNLIEYSKRRVHIYFDKKYEKHLIKVIFGIISDEYQEMFCKKNHNN